MKKFFSFTVCSFLVFVSFSQQVNIYPTHWWIGMKNPNLQLIIHQENIAGKVPMYKLSAGGMKLAEGVTLKAVNRVENPNYLFLDLVIDKNAKPGIMPRPECKSVRISDFLSLFPTFTSVGKARAA